MKAIVTALAVFASLALVAGVSASRRFHRLQRPEEQEPRRLPAQVFPLPRRQARTDADARVGEDRALHSWPGLVPCERSAYRCEPAPAQSAGAEQRPHRL